MRKICVITGTRAEYGVLKPLLSLIKESKGLELQLVVCGMHLMSEFGSSVDLIRKDGFKISAELAMFSKKEGKLEMAESLSRGINGFARILEKLKPDILLLEADRLEMLAAALASVFFNIPIVHISGGDLSGGLDDSIRHTLSRFAHLHLVNTRGSYKRLLKMGEPAWRIRYVGTLAVSKEILSQSVTKKELEREFKIDLSRLLFLVIQHPVVSQAENAAFQMRQTLDAVSSFKEQTLIFYPNCDLGGKAIINQILKYKKLNFIRIHKNVERSLYLGLLKHASVIVGNSSSGIVEAPLFGTPVVNIGSRQDGRERAANLVDVGYDKKEIILAIKKFQKNNFRRIYGKNPYRDYNTEKRIVSALRTIKIDERLLNKKLTF
jgi:GDP/UDP-N,N'-diacetylbacillosamine 2-epimerase (hydrolysing)